MTHQAEMTDNRRVWLESRAIRMGYPKGRVNFTTCGVCGGAEWSGTFTKDSSGQTIEALEVTEFVHPPGSFGYSCSPCREVMIRAPEVYTWVLGCIDWSRNGSHEPRS